MAASRHRFKVVLYGTAQPVQATGIDPDLGFRLTVEGSNTIELLSGFLSLLRLYGFGPEAIAAALQGNLQLLALKAQQANPQTPPQPGEAGDGGGARLGDGNGS